MKPEKKKDFYKFICLGMLVLFISSLVPVLLLAATDAATGDDYGYSAATRLIWLQTGSVWEVIKAAAQQVGRYYQNWQGTWFSLFLFAFQPEAFERHAYWTVPVITLALQIGTTLWLAAHFLGRRLRWQVQYWLPAALLLLFLEIQFVPSTKSAIYWYNGTVHYMLPMAMAVICVILGDHFIVGRRARDLIFMTVLMTLLGGMSYQAALLAPLAVCIDLGMRFLKDRTNGASFELRPKLWLLLPFLAELAGLIVSAMAPGNKVRGGENFGFSGGNVAAALGTALADTAADLKVYAVSKLWVYLFLFLLALFIWKAENVQEIRKERFQHPFVFLLLLVLLNIAMHVPAAFANVEVSGGVGNTNFQVMCMSFCAGCIYVAGWAAGRGHREESAEHRNKMILWIAAGAIGAVLLIGGRHSFVLSTDYICLNYITSGQAADYREQMEQQYTLLTQDGVTDPVVPMINDAQGPLMHMPITTDPTNFTNSSAADYYGRNTVTGMERSQWNELYGQ